MSETKAAGVKMEAASLQKFTVQLTHLPSGTLIQTDAPRDNGGEGSSFSPTDLVGAALASCALTTMSLVASRSGIVFAGGSAAVEKVMTPPPRRIASLELVLTLPGGLSATERGVLEEAATGCPVARSLHPDVSCPMRFVYA